MSRTPQRILVTGAWGQVGRQLVGRLLDRGRTVIAADLHGSAPTRLPAGAAHLVVEALDITDAAAVTRVVTAHAPDAIVHLAAVVSPPCYRHPEAARRVNVDGTRHLVDAELELEGPPVFAFASSAGVYGPRNPHRHHDRITPDTAVSPVDCYGVDMIDAEQLLATSGLPHVVLRLAGVASPEPPSGPDYLVLMRAIPCDNRVHMVDARDVALAFANAVDRIDRVDGMTLLVGGDDSHALTHSVVQDDMFEAFGLGRVGAGINLPGNPDDDRGWSFTDWFDTTRSQQLLGYQEHTWDDTLAWVRERLGPRRHVIRAVSPLARPALRTVAARQRRREGRGPWADPWDLIARTYGERVLVPSPANSTDEA